MKSAGGNHQTVTGSADEAPLRIVIADSGSIRSQLLARALRARRNFNVTTTSPEAATLHRFLESNSADIVLVAGNRGSDLRVLRWLHISHPKVAAILLVENCDRQLVVDAFRAGAKGIFQSNEDP